MVTDGWQPVQFSDNGTLDMGSGRVVVRFGKSFRTTQNIDTAFKRGEKGNSYKEE